MDFYKTAAFASPYAENDYPILVALNEYLNVKYSAESSLKFNDYDVVYFHCELLACYKGSSNSR